LENDLKNGRLRGVISTNALELGIDIGSLDAVIISGYPGTAISTWQQAGRSGRGRGESIAALVAYEDALDQYFLRNPEVFFQRPPEHAVIDLANPHICAGHIMCAAAEMPIDVERDRDLLGPETEAVLGSLGRHGLVSRTQRGWVYSGKARPAEVVSLDGAGSEVFTLVTDGRTLGTMDRNQAYREAHEGAVLVHQGETYIVESLDLKDRTAYAKKAEVDYYTVPLKSAELRITGVLRRKTEKGVPVAVGPIGVTERFTGYKVVRQDKILGVRPLSLPPLEFNTVGLWFTVADEIGGDIRKAGRDFGGGLHGVEHAMISVIPFHVLCDRHDLGGLSTPLHQDTLEPTIFVYDGFEGGIGIAERAYDLFPEIIRMTFDLIRECPCDDGCPACIYSPKCGNDNRPLDKKACIEILSRLA
jgi:DEAD/DEAH box helicase domain-containing protein